jgi:tRNA threonylcarbamoyladenosine biosynthesis protein TsaB
MTPEPEPRLLLIETSGAEGLVGCGVGNQLVAEVRLDQQRKHTRDLIPQIQGLLKQLGWKASDLVGIAVSWGPGSYTGLRVGLMTGKTLAYVLGKPLIPVPTFEVIATNLLGVMREFSEIDVIADAQQDRVYQQNFRLDHASRQVLPVSELTVVDGEKWRRRLTECTLVTGPGLKQQVTKLPPRLAMVPENLWSPSLSSLLKRGLNRLEKRAFADPFTVEPLYARPSSAEEKWTALGK